MMKKFLLIAGCALGLAACQTTATTQNIIQGAQTAAMAFCAIEPTAATIAALVTADPALTTASLAAQAFCKLVTPATVSANRRLAAPRRGLVDYGTVVVNGQKIELEGTPK